MKKIYLIIFLIFLSSCSEDENKENKDGLLHITFATDWKAQAEQGGFYQALASGKYLKKYVKSDPPDLFLGEHFRPKSLPW